MEKMCIGSYDLYKHAHGIACVSNTDSQIVLLSAITKALRTVFVKPDGVTVVVLTSRGFWVGSENNLPAHICRLFQFSGTYQSQKDLQAKLTYCARQIIRYRNSESDYSYNLFRRFNV